jgi:hypothetical protein
LAKLFSDEAQRNTGNTRLFDLMVATVGYRFKTDLAAGGTLLSQYAGT